jgi:hypothetical protein
MGPRSLALLFAGLVGLASADADLSLQPRQSEYALEGIKLKQLAFSDGGSKEVTYQQPPGWDYSGSSDRLTLHPAGKSQAEATISRVTLPDSGKLGEGDPGKLVAEAIASAPKDSTQVKIISQGQNSLKISGKQSFQVVMAYTLQGQTFNRSILFLNRDHEQLRFQLTARERDFKDLERSFEGSLCTWQNL